jgi:nucleoside-diphosphate-sugar epimerase
MPALLRAGFEAFGWDLCWFDERPLIPAEAHWPVIRKDVRQATPRDLLGFDAVVHLAALSNDPLGEIDPNLTRDINHRASVRIAKMARGAGVQRFVFSSSCSMYGQAGAAALDESAAFNPQTVYAESKVLAERDIALLADETFSPVYLRNATAYGLSPCQRFDLVLPNLSGFAHTTGEVRLQSDGTPWRPLVHIRDICNAVIASLRAPRETIHNEAFNIGRNQDNYQIRDIALAVHRAFEGSQITFGPSSKVPDTRSYRVDFTKAATKLPGFKPEWDLDKGVQECVSEFRRIGLSPFVFQHRVYTRLRQIRHLIEHNQLDEQLRWKAA